MSATRLARLLIVDDEAAQMTALCQTLDEEGYSTTGFTSAKEALAAMPGQQFDLLLTYLMMPEMDGIALLRTAQEIDPDLVGIVMTGHGAVQTAVEAMKAGAIDYILKPFKLSGILPVLTRALALQRLRNENKELERRVRDRTAELEVANKELETFSYSVSHDLQAPLRHIKLYAEILVKGLGDTLDEGNRRCVQNITEAAEQMRQLIDNLLEFSRMGRVEMNQTEVDLNLVIQETIKRLETETAGRNIVWKLAPLPLVQGDPFLLRQVLVNLLANAIKYTRPRDPAQIEISCLSETADEAVMIVRDNGVGFDMTYASRLFGVFQRLHRADQFEGIGVGLANVQRIITRHTGRIWAESVVNEGASFFFSLRKAQKQSQPRPAAAADAAGAAPAP